jgi:cobalt-zinc-cadmium efflux system outer membrane protein
MLAILEQPLGWTKKPIAHRFRRGLVLLASLVPLAASATPLDERAAVERLCTEGPDAAVAAAQRLAGEADVRAASALPNPSLVLEHQRALGGTSEHETVAGLSVPLGVGGRYGLLQDAAAERRRERELGADVSSFEAALTFREVYLGAALAQARAEILLSQQRVLDALGATIVGLERGGEAAAYDVLRQSAHARAHRRALASARALAEGERARLEAWVGAPIVVTLDVAARSPTEPRTETPRVAQLEAAAQTHALEARAAERRWVPELELFAGYREATVAEDTGRGLSLGLTVPLTVFDHGQGEAARARADEALARAAADGLRRQQRADQAALRARLAALDGAADQDALPEAERLQAQALQLYAAGEATLTELLEALSAAEAARLDAVALDAERAAIHLAMMRVAGTFFDDTLDGACRGGAEAPR